MSVIDSSTASLPAQDRLGPGSEETAPVTTILIVDDSPVDRRLASSILARDPRLRVLTAGNGNDALDRIAREHVTAVVTDLQMPGMDGLALVEEVRHLHSRIPVILMTAYGSEEIAIKALRAGAANYVPKKAMARDLTDTIHAVLALSAVDERRQKLSRSMVATQSSFRLENDPDLLSPLVSRLQEDLDGMSVCDVTGRTRLGVALQESLSNALYHGNLEVSSDLRQEDERVFYTEARARRRAAPYRHRRIHVSAEIDRQGATYRIRDEGPGFDVSTLDAPFDPESLMRIGGRGMILIRTFMDEVRHNAMGNEITLIKRWHAG